MPFEEAPERTGVLVIRAWHEPGRAMIVVRLTGRADLRDVTETRTTVVGVEAAVELTREWLLAGERDGYPAA